MKGQLDDDEKIKIIYNSLEDIEELEFYDIQDKINFNKYMLYLNCLEVENKISIKIYHNYLNKIRKIIIKKLSLI
ncbi:hypothetical protein [Fusobacterium ulcerans]|uniref:hypothetical protein n=1 Tax=Fusobacterium ulcerans TaxID=861 RepID=UPI00241E92E5|nr:hypothetical protein [Fusobacterium ulcerans]